MAADDGFLRVTLTPVGRAFALDLPDDPLDDPFGDDLGTDHGRRFGDFAGPVVVGDFFHGGVVEEQCRQGLRQLRAVPVKGVGLEAQAPGQHVGFLAVFDGGAIGHVDGLRDGAGDERLAGGHHADMAFHRQVTLAVPSAGAGTVENGEMFVLDMGRAFQGHGPADKGVGGVDLVGAESQRFQHFEGHLIEAGGVQAKGVYAEFLAQRPLVEDETDVEGFGQRPFDGGDSVSVEFFGGQGLMTDSRRVLEGSVTDGIVDDVLDLVFRIAEAGKGLRHRPVDDLEIAAAGQFLELDQGEIGLDPRGVTVHDQADGAGRRDHRDLGVPIAMGLAQFQGLVPGIPGRPCQVVIGALGGDEGHRRHRKPLIAGFGAMGGTAVVADDPEHGLPVVLESREGAHFGRHFRRRRISLSGHQRRDGAANGPPGFRIIRNAGRHQITPDVGEAEAEGAEIVAQFGDFIGRELGHHHRDFEGDDP